jgi:hypothetical protein
MNGQPVGNKRGKVIKRLQHAPPPIEEKKKKKHILCRHYDVKGFMRFTLQPESATEIG